MEGFQRFVRRYITFPVCLQKVMSRKKSDSTVAKKKKKTDEGSSFLAFVPTFSTNSRGNACYAGLVTVL